MKNSAKSSPKSEIPFVDVQIPLEAAIPQILFADDSACQISAILRQIRPKWKLEACKMKIFTNGITNKIFSVADNDEAEKLVFRIFGAGTDKIIDRQSELDAFERLAEAGLAPRIHARFQNGIVCGFLPGECLSVESVRQPNVVDLICREMAAMHKIPLKSDEQHSAFGSTFTTKSKQWLASLPSKFPSEQCQKQFDEYFAGLDLSAQFLRLQTALDRLSSPLVFCHNDLLIFNILLDEANGKVHFIDYEYAGPNCQLFDVANHFCEYAGLDNPDYEGDGPTEGQRKYFLSQYIFHFQGQKPDEGELAKLMRETVHFEAAAHLFWTLWAIHQANLSRISFDYLEYAVSRHRQFLRLLAQLDI